MSSDADYVFNKRPERVYFTKQFNTAEPPEEKLARFGSRVFEEGERPEFAVINKELVLRVGPAGRQQIKVLYFTDNREIAHIAIQRFRIEDDRPIGGTLLHLRGEEVTRFLDLVRVIEAGTITGPESVRIDEGFLDQFAMTDAATRRFVLENQDLIAEIVSSELTTQDVVSLGYRKRQLELFEQLLYQRDFFKNHMAEKGIKRPEDVWQRFFERNTWVLGYGLTYLFSTPLTGKKLEQVVSGFSVGKPGKRVDALLRTRGFISSLCFAEIKTHETPLIRQDAERSGTWAPSAELAAAVAQVHKTVQGALETIRTKLETTDIDYTPTGETSFLYRPRSVLLIGNLREFQSGAGIHEGQYSSFELFRRHLTEPEIITYDELLERAKNIVRSDVTSTAATA
jgi:hypothetical protein